MLSSFRRAGAPLQRICPAVEVLKKEIGVDHALASKSQSRQEHLEGLRVTGLTVHSMADIYGDAPTEAAVRVFCLTNRNLRGAEQTERFIANRHRILRQAGKPGPYIYGVYAEGLKRLWP